MYKRLLYIEDLYEFYSKSFDDKSVHFSYKDKGEPIVVQVHGSINFEDTSDIDGLMPVHLQACHTLKNRNNSNIEKDVMTAALPSFKNRPILGYIHKVPDENGDEQYQFYAHNIHEEGDEVITDGEIFLGTEHTVMHARSEIWLPNVGFDGSWADWTKMGEVPLTQLAQKKAEAMLEKDKENPVDDSLDAEAQKILEAARKELL